MTEGRVPPHMFVVFGATGDLARRKLLPAIHGLSRRGEIREGRQHVLGVARTDLDDEGWQTWAREALGDAGSGPLDSWCDRCLSYQPMDGEEGEYEALAERIAALEEEHDLPGNRAFYLAVPPKIFPEVIRGLGEAGLAESRGWTRIVVEKPFGEDLATARELNELVHRWFDEEQIYRIDHFLGKETIQNLLVFRFANAMFESLWNRDRVESVEITVAEDIGVGTRAGYYDGVGALRDMVQNHLAQILTLVTMEVPVAYAAEAIRNEKVKVLRAIRPIDPRNVVFGRYGRGRVGGEAVPGYLDEPDVPEGSRTETYAALRLEIDTWRWQGVPFYLRTGKRMPRQLTEVAVHFRRPPVSLFRSLELMELDQDVLLITLQPDEGFTLLVDVKRPGSPLTLEKIPLGFGYRERFGELADAYVTLLLDVLRGDQTLFVHAEEVEAAWRLFDPLLEGGVRVHEYEAGSWGPRQADQLLARDGHVWREQP